MPSRVVLEAVRGPFKSTAFTFDDPHTFLVGRAADCHAELSDDTQLSRHHFMLEVNPPDVFLHDLGSLNGTFVNNKKCAAQKALQGQRLRHGDVVQAGRSAFKLQIEVPLMCASCGKVDDATLSHPKGMHLCDVCAPTAGGDRRPRGLLSRLVPGGAARTDSVVPMGDYLHCQRCGADLSRKADRGRAGAVVCSDCRGKVLQDPQELMTYVLEAASHQATELSWQPVQFRERRGNSVVYEARRKSDNSTVAIKLVISSVPVDDDLAAAVSREAAPGKELNHPNCVKLLDDGHLGGVFWFMTEMCAGGSMADRVEKLSRPLVMDEAGPAMRQALKGLAYCHEKGLVHGAIKPSNLLLTGADGEVKLTDVAVARALVRTGARGISLPLDFTPREQLLDVKNVRPLSDVWAMAATFYFMLTGSVPRDSAADENPLTVLLHAPVVPITRHLPQLKKGVADVFDIALSEQKSVRYANAGAFLTALEAALG